MTGIIEIHRRNWRIFFWESLGSRTLDKKLEEPHLKPQCDLGTNEQNRVELFIYKRTALKSSHYQVDSNLLAV